MNNLQEVEHSDGVGSYFPAIRMDDGQRIQYAHSLDREGISYMAPDVISNVRYYEAFPVRGDIPRWHFCVFDPLDYEVCGDSPEPVGYCAENCAGHATPEVAKEHYRQYLLDRVDFEALLIAAECRVCGRPAAHQSKIAGFLGGMGFVTIPNHDREIQRCEAHANRDTSNTIFLLSEFQEFVSI